MKQNSYSDYSTVDNIQPITNEELTYKEQIEKV